MNWGALNDGWMHVSQIKLFHNYINCPALLTLNYPIMRLSGKPEVWKWVKIKRIKVALARRNVICDFISLWAWAQSIFSSEYFIHFICQHWRWFSLAICLWCPIEQITIYVNYFHTLPPYYLSSDLEWWFCDYDRDKRAPKDGESREAAKATTTTSLSGTDKRRAVRGKLDKLNF